MGSSHRAPRVDQLVPETRRAGVKRVRTVAGDAVEDARWVRQERRRLAQVQSEYEGDVEMSTEETDVRLPLGAATGEAAWAHIGAMRSAIRRRMARQSLRQSLPQSAARGRLRTRGAEACAVARQGTRILHARPQDPFGVTDMR